jgi:hypothetical protein
MGTAKLELLRFAEPMQQTHPIAESRPRMERGLVQGRRLGGRESPFGVRERCSRPARAGLKHSFSSPRTQPPLG